jgi:hypothetical protein
VIRNFFLTLITCLSLMACGTDTSNVIPLPTPNPQDTPTPTPPVETPAPTPEIEPIPEPMLDFSSSVNTQTKPDSRVPGTWSTVGKLLNPNNASKAIALKDGRVLLVSFGYSEFKETNGKLVTIKRNAGSGEVFDPATGTSTPFQNLDYNSGFQLKDGRVVFFHPNRSSIFDPKSNTFQHLNVPGSSCPSGFSLTEIPGDRLQLSSYGNQTPPCEFDLKTGQTRASNDPTSKTIAHSSGPGIFGFYISEVVFQGPQDSTWKVTPLFDLKKQYTETDADQPSDFRLEQFDRASNLVAAFIMQLPKSIYSAKFISKDLLDFRSGEVGDYGPTNCKHTYFNVAKKKMMSSLAYYCGKHHGENGTIVFDQSSVLLYNRGEYGNAGHQGMSLLNLETSERMDFSDRGNGDYKEVREAFQLSDQSVFLHEVMGCPSQYLSACRLSGLPDQTEILEAKSHSFRAVPPLNQARFFSIGVQLCDGRIMVLGGQKQLPAHTDQYGNLQATFEPVDSIEIYTPEN